VLDAEKFAVFAGLLGGAKYPEAALAKAWVQLAYGAHHDAITGSESDQVYLDLLTGWRDAWELGRTARDNALALLSSAVHDPVVVWNALAHKRTDVVTARFEKPVAAAVQVFDSEGTELPVHIEHGGRSVSWLARDVPSLGWQSYRLAPAEAADGWEPLDGNTIANEHYRLRVDPARGGGVSSLIETVSGRELIGDGVVGNELAVYDEYPAHPEAGEGPWHLLPKGPVVCSSAEPASVQAYRGPIGERLIVRGRIGDVLRYTQTLTLWQGVARVDCRTTVHEFTGADRLLRLRWPCPVPGALPVSEVGDAVIGRGFGLMHEAGAETAVDSAKHPWTLDNPAYGWFGLSSAVRVCVGKSADERSTKNHRCRAVSVAEVVSPTEAESAGLARALMVALVRAGVTATCSSADKPRYGDLAVDSNLPDARIALGGPDENAFTAAVLAEADPVYAEELKRQLYSTGAARVWVPPVGPFIDEWVPGADLRGVRTLPVLIIAGSELGVVVDSVVEDLGDFEIVVEQEVPSGLGAFEDRTVAVLNRGMPGFAVDSDGTLHTSLMRSCTGWPSGTWIDPPRRTAPDGSNFQLQHWTHTFEYALVSGDGDWREAGVPARSAEFSRPLLPTAEKTEAAGGLPHWGSLLEIEPAGRVQLGALKAAGNPLASGSSQTIHPSDGVAVRLVETSGTTTDVVVRSGLRRVSAAARVDLLEQPRVQHLASDGLTLHGYEIATVLTRLNMPQVIEADHTVLAPDAEAAQPLYARYWLHNRGPAALGGLPAIAYLHPQHIAAEPNSQVQLRLTASSDCSDTMLHGKVRLLCPDGWTAEPAELSFVLPPGEHLEADVTLTAPSAAEPGLYPVRADLGLTGSHLPSAWRQVVEDVCVVTLGTPAEDSVLRLVSEPEPIDIKGGQTARLAVTVGTDAYADVAVEAHLISPWGTWEWMGPAAFGVELAARGTAELGFDVAPPVWVEPGEWWALIRVGGAGQLLYSSAVKVTAR
ncbi:MAG: alpha-mannosidase, partial [Mycobacterium sp.]|nr:alpha-mannosidase [Mycobacterium sp.]